MNKNNVITFFIFICLFIPQNVLAYVITVKDTSAYQFQNSKYLGPNPLYSTSYEVNLDVGEILEIVVEKNIDGKKDDVASVNATNFKIISNDNEQIVAVSFTSKGEQMFTLKKDGRFHFYQTLHALQDYPPHKKGDSFSVVSFGGLYDDAKWELRIMDATSVSRKSNKHWKAILPHINLREI